MRRNPLRRGPANTPWPACTCTNRFRPISSSRARTTQCAQKYGYATGQCELRAAEGLVRVSEVSMLCADHLAQQLLVVHEQLENLPVAQVGGCAWQQALGWGLGCG